MFFAIVAVLFAIIFIKTITMVMRSPRVIYIRLLSVPTFCIMFILCLILMSDTTTRAAVNGLHLWAGAVVPSLLPFFVAAEILNATGFIRASGVLLEPVMRPFFNVPGCSSFALAMGVTSGYPVGAKITCDLRNSGELSKTEGERLLAFTNNSGPLFIVGAVGTGMYGSPKLGIFLLLCHFLACITVGFLFRFYKPAGYFYKKKHSVHKSLPSQQKSLLSQPNKRFYEFKKKLLDEYKTSKSSFGTILGDAVKSSVTTILAIGGFIVLFSVIIHILADTGIIGFAADALAYMMSPFGIDNAIIKGVLSGIFEITTGSRQVSSAAGIPVSLQLPAASLIIGWAGLSVHFQVMSIAAKTDLSVRPYLFGKLLQGIVSAIYTWAGLKLLNAEAVLGEAVLGDAVLGSTLPFPRLCLHTFNTAVLLLSIVLVIFAVLSIAGQHKVYLLKRRR